MKNDSLKKIKGAINYLFAVTFASVSIASIGILLFTLLVFWGPDLGPGNFFIYLFCVGFATCVALVINLVKSYQNKISYMQYHRFWKTKTTYIISGSIVCAFLVLLIPRTNPVVFLVTAGIIVTLTILFVFELVWDKEHSKSPLTRILDLMNSTFGSDEIFDGT